MVVVSVVGLWSEEVRKGGSCLRGGGWNVEALDPDSAPPPSAMHRHYHVGNPTRKSLAPAILNDGGAEIAHDPITFRSTT